jgi:asparagine synthase (glutamine-hydrolysing)
MPALIAGILECAGACGDNAPAVHLQAVGRGPSSYRAGPLRVVADATFHDHEELADALGEPRRASPAQLVAAAWRARGEDCTDLFDGDFAFALHDAARGVLVCARDPFGVRPLYYRSARGRFAFASSIAALREVLGEDLALSDRSVADFVLGRVTNAHGTFHEGIRRLPAAHRIAVRTGEEGPSRYWRLAPDPDAAREPNPGRRFRDLFERAIERRTRRAARPAALLSGGLDSSSIACVARAGQDGPLPAYSMFFSEPERCNERRFIDAVLDRGGFAPTIMSRDDYRPFARIEALLEAMDGPVLAPNLACMDPLVARAAAEGTDVLLDGHGGDEVVSHGYGRLDDLARAGDWIGLWREAAAAADNFGKPTAQLVRSIARRHPRFDARVMTKALGLVAPGPQARGSRPHLLARDFIERCGSLKRAPATPPGMGEQAQHLATLDDPLQSYAFEVLARFYRSHGIEPRFPFWDRDLVRFCVGLPASAKLAGGWSRLVLREAMRGVIPEEVRLRRDKVDFAYPLARGMVRHHDAMIRDLLEGGGGIEDYVDLAGARQVYAGIAADPSRARGPDVQQVWRIVTLAVWLRMERGPSPTRTAQSAPSLAGARP